MANDEEAETPGVLPSVAHLVAVNAEFAVLLCAKASCRRAQAIGGIEEHLRKFYHEKPTVCRKVGEFGQKLARRDARFLHDYTVVGLPVNGSAPQPVVPVVDGFSCRFCYFLTVSRAMVRMHVNKAHSRRGEADDDISAQVRLQTWYGPKRERYWVVNEGTCGADGSAEGHRAAEDATNRSEHVVDKIEEDIRRWQAKATERRLALSAKPLAYELDPWLNFTKWHAVISRSKHDMLRTYAFLRYPERDDKKMRRLLREWDVVKARALDTLEDVDHKDALKWWVSPKNEVASQNPFELPQSSRTLGQYSRMWEQFICYVVRTMPEGANEATETGVVYTREQQEAVEDIQDVPTTTTTTTTAGALDLPSWRAA